MTKARDLAVFNAAGVLTSTSNLNATKLTSGTIPNARYGTPTFNGSNLTGIDAGGGITQYQQWRLTSNSLNSNASDADITQDLEKVDTNGAATIGSDMVESGGIFTFPSTGKYLITFTGNAYSPDASDDRGVNFKIKTTTNNAQFQTASDLKQVMLWTPNGNAQYCAATVTAIFDVTNTATHKCLFAWGSSQGTSIYLRGDTSQTQTSFQFMKLAD